MEQVKFVEDSLSFVSIIFHDFHDIITIWVKGYCMPQILKNVRKWQTASLGTKVSFDFLYRNLLHFHGLALA